MSTTFLHKDFYRVLQVTPEATLADIKKSYYKLVKDLHPDRHDASDDDKTRQVKLREFRLVTEAYTTLSNPSLKRQYDVQHNYRSRAGMQHAAHRTRIYAPQPPPEWKGVVYNHKVHHDYHYGDGMYRDALNKARKEAREEYERAGGYQSPLGPGFAFGSRHDRNPYSKHPQQGERAEFVFEYEEGYVNAGSKCGTGSAGGGAGAGAGAGKSGGSGGSGVFEGKATYQFKQRVVEEMYAQRASRRAQSQQPTQRRNASFAPKSTNECVIL
jgi:curved DNA-binding protein CbpA